MILLALEVGGQGLVMMIAIFLAIKRLHIFGLVGRVFTGLKQLSSV